MFKLELNLNINILPLKKRHQNIESAITVVEDVGAIELCGEGSGGYMNRTFMFVVITTEGTADSNVDYNPNTFPSILLFSEDASNTQCVTITIYDDEDMENDETFYITVTNPSFEDGPSNVTLSNSNFTVTIHDDNEPGSAAFTTAPLSMCVLSLMGIIATTRMLF